MRAFTVRLPARTVGELTQSRDGQVRFTPDALWEQEEQRPRLGIDFLRTRGPRVTSGDLPTWFENLIPELESPLRSRLCAANGLRNDQSVLLLAAVGHDLPGAVEIHGYAGAEDDNDETQPPFNPSGEGEISPAVSAHTDRLHLSALAGNQLKFSMSMVNERLTLGARAGRDQWIVKFPGTDFPELPEVEQATMSWARQSGFQVPSHAVMPVERLSGIPASWIEPNDPTAQVFAIKRFDRRSDGSKIHHEDLCQVLALRPASKYGNSIPGVSFDGALRIVTDVCGETEGREMARRAGFMVASGNGDAHLKNWALLWGEQIRPKLTPCYDLVATISWPRLGWAEDRVPRLALKFGGSRRFSYLDDARVALCAGSTGHSWFEAEFREGISRARDAWRSRSFGAPQRMESAISEHWRRVPILHQLGL